MSLVEKLAATNRALEQSRCVREFCNLARCLALTKGGMAQARRIAHEHRLGPTLDKILSAQVPVAGLNFEQRAAVAAGSTTDSAYAGPLSEFQTLSNAFVESLRNFSAFDRMLPNMKRVPFRTRIGASTVGVVGDTIGQQAPKKISSLNLTGTTISETKAVAILVVTQELARFGANVAGDLFATELQNAVAVETDETFVATLTSGA